MKNLLKSVMLMLLIMPFFGCESEPLEMSNQDQSRISALNAITTNTGPCSELQSLAKFVNYGSYDTDFKVYDSEGTILASEFLNPTNSSELKLITPTTNVTVVIRNSENVFTKTISMKTCILYTIMIDASNTLTMYNSVY